MTHYPFFPNRKIHCLDGIWDFTLLHDLEQPETINLDTIKYTNRLSVPGVFDACPAYLGQRGTGVYKTALKVTPGTAGILKFGGIGLWGEIYIDGQKLHTCQIPYSGFSVKIPASQKTWREVVVVVDNRFDAKRVPLFEQFFDFYGYGGIYRSVEWHELPQAGYWERAYIDIIDLHKGLIAVNAVHVNGSPEPIFEIDGKQVKPNSLNINGDTLQATLQLPTPTLWTIDNPNLHILQISTADDTIVERFGLRTIETVAGQIKINGEAIKLKGFCRHEAHPQYGPALPLAQLVQDLQLLKELGCNFVRGSHYPQDQRFLDICDELGVVVFEETLGWGQQKDSYAAEDFGNLQEAQTRLMIRNSYNHPAVIMWGFLNEGGSNRQALKPLYERLIKCIRAEDASRAVTYASMLPFDDLHFDLCDIICINTYPGWYSEDQNSAHTLHEIIPKLNDLVENLKERDLANKPLIISEIGAGAIYGWRDPSANRWSEQFQEEYLAIASQHILDSDNFAGIALWQFCDCRTYANVGTLFRPRGFNNKGIVDEYRRPKLAYQKIKQLFSSTV